MTRNQDDCIEILKLIDHFIMELGNEKDIPVHLMSALLKVIASRLDLHSACLDEADIRGDP